MSGPGELSAILLAGGRASRVQGAVKPLFVVGGTTLLRTAVEAVRDAGAHRVTVVGSVLDERLDVEWVREEPPFGGPAAAVVAALRTWPEKGAAEWTILLACDLPRAADAVRRLVADAALVPPDTDGVCLADRTSRPQWLTGIYRTRALRRAASALPGAGRDLPVRALVDDLALAVVVDHEGVTDDVDTWEDLERARARIPGTSARAPKESS